MIGQGILWISPTSCIVYKCAWVNLLWRLEVRSNGLTGPRFTVCLLETHSAWRQAVQVYQTFASQPGRLREDHHWTLGTRLSFAIHL